MSSNTYTFKMEMTCEGCSNAAKRVLERIGVKDVVADLKEQKLTVTSDKPAKEILETLQKTGKKVEIVS